MAGHDLWVTATRVCHIVDECFSIVCLSLKENNIRKTECSLTRSATIPYAQPGTSDISGESTYQRLEYCFCFGERFDLDGCYRCNLRRL